MRQGFSLVELSIVLVILGLLVGGILTGQSLIRAAELRSVTTEYQTYHTALYTFRDKYFAIPGDMKNATDFWGSAGGSGTIGDGCEAVTGTGTQTCNGDGDNELEYNAADEYGELFTFWQHLNNAGLIEGSYTGIAGSGGQNDHVLGTNAPRAKLSNAGWGMAHNDTQSGNAAYFDGVYDHNVVIGSSNSGTRPIGDIFTPEEAWNIDKKVDDGMPATGKIRPRDRKGGCTIGTDGNDLTNSTADAAELDATYKLSESSVVCALLFVQLF